MREFKFMIGSNQMKVDDRNRVIIPQKFREIIGSSFYMILSFDDDSVFCCDAEGLDEYIKKIKNSETYDETAREYRLKYAFNHSDMVTSDSQGRTVIREDILAKLGLKKGDTAVAVGEMDHFVIRKLQTAESDDEFMDKDRQLEQEIKVKRRYAQQRLELAEVEEKIAEADARIKIAKAKQEEE